MILRVSKENWHTLSLSGVQFYFRLFNVEIMCICPGIMTLLSLVDKSPNSYNLYIYSTALMRPLTSCGFLGRIEAL